MEGTGAIQMIPTKGSPEDIKIKARIQKAKDLIARLKSDNSFARLLQLGNECHDEQGRFCEGVSDTGSVNNQVLDHTDKQIKDLQDLIDNYKDQPGSDNVIKILNRNIKDLQEKKASGAVPYNGVDLYKTPEDDAKNIRSTMDIITSVHPIDPTLEPVRIGYDEALRGGVLGAYKPAFNTIGLQNTKDAFSMVHELGHWQTLNPNFNLETSKNPSDLFLSNVNKLGLGNIFYNITQSQAMRNIGQRANDKNSDEQAYNQYLNSPHEAYARAYAQYIAITAEDLKLRGQFEMFRSNNRTRSLQWSDEDFAPIKKAFDEHFKEGKKGKN